MQIHFARYESKSKRYLYGYWVALVIGGLAAISSNPNGFGIAQLLLAAAFVLLALYASGLISDNYGEGYFQDQEISGDEYMALNSRLQMYPELQEKLLDQVGAISRVTYAQAIEIEQIVNQHTKGARAQQDEETRGHNREQLLKTISGGKS